MNYNRISSLGDDFKSLVPYGATPVAVRRAGELWNLLCELRPDIDDKKRWRELAKFGISQIHRTVDYIEKMMLLPDEAKAYRYLFVTNPRYDIPGPDPCERRRAKVIEILNLPYGTSTWRREPERLFMVDFAKVFVVVSAEPED